MFSCSPHLFNSHSASSPFSFLLFSLLFLRFPSQLSHLITVHHRDVCSKSDDASDPSSDPGGFNVPPSTAEAVFLDLPEPWLAVPSAATAMKRDGRICSYSPCIEQSQKCTAALMSSGFHSVKTVEVRLKEYYVDVVRPEMVVPVAPFYVGATQIEKCTQERKDRGDVKTTKVQRKRKASEDGEEGRERIVRARPAAEMRGHTAFLTFATRCIERREEGGEEGEERGGGGGEGGEK